MKYFAAILVSFLLHGADASPKSGPRSPELDLYGYLIRNYVALVRPVKDRMTPVNVSFGMTPLMIREVDEKHQTIVVDSWIDMRWKDEYHSWDPDVYSNIKALRVSSSIVWRPDISLYSASPVSGTFLPTPGHVWIYSSGEVQWLSTLSISSRCPIPYNSEKFTCDIEFGSWTYSMKELNPILNSTQVDLSNFHDINPDWYLVDFKVNRVSKFHACCSEEEQHPRIIYKVTLKKRVI